MVGKERLPRSHEWVCEFTVKNKNKGRAKGDFIIGKKKEGTLDKCKFAKKGKGVIRSDIDKELILSIISVYGEQGRKNLIESLEVMT